MEEYKLANDEIHAPQELKETVLAGLPPAAPPASRSLSPRLDC